MPTIPLLVKWKHSLVTFYWLCATGSRGESLLTMSSLSHVTHLEMGQEIKLQFYQQEEPVIVRFVDANNLVDMQNALQWILGGMNKEAVVGIDLEWVAENQSWQLHPTYSPISLIQIASHGRCVLLTTLGHLHHTSAAYLRGM